MISRLLTSAFVAAFAFARVSAATPTYVNFSTVTNVPQIDATAYVNFGEFLVSGILPYETQNTLVFTNYGVMSSVPGFRLETVSSTGVRQPAQTFYNGPDASLNAGFSSASRQFAASFTNLNSLGAFTLERSQLLISAKDIINRGHIRADGGGRVLLQGENVDLERSDVGILPLFGGQGFITPTNFFPELGIFDTYHGLTDPADPNQPLLPLGSLARLVRRTNIAVNVPFHNVTNFIGDPFGFSTLLSLTNARGFVLTNAVTPTNWLIQAVFVQTADTNIAVDVKFGPSTIPTNQYTTPVVELKTIETNVLDAATFNTTVYILDRMVSETNFVILTNLDTQVTGMPSTYEVTRVTPVEFAGGAGTNAVFTQNLLANPGYTNSIVTNVFAAYGFIVTNIDFQIPNIPGATLSNAPGRVEISAQNLNLNRTRLRGEGFVSIETENLIGNANSALDIINLSLRLASASGEFRLQSLLKPFVQRTTGPIFLWSGSWTNQFGITNSVPPADPMQPPTVETNVVDIGFHVMVVDANTVASRLPVVVKDFVVRNDEVTIADVLRVSEQFFTTARNLTIAASSQVTFQGTLRDFTPDNVPNLVNFTNLAAFTVAREAHVGTGPNGPLEHLLNRGTISAFSHIYRVNRFEHLGRIIANVGLGGRGTGTVAIEGDFVRLEGASIQAGGQVDIHANDLRMRGFTSTNFQTLVLDVRNSIADSLEDSTNFLTSEGFHLTTKPAFGDLLGTFITSLIPKFLAIDHTWAGEDRGPTPAGFENNVAVGKLKLDGGFDSQFVFRGVGGNNALYVDFLELTGIITNDIPAAFRIEPGMVIYFADSNIPVEELDGLFADDSAPNGRLRWVRDFAGPQSSTDVLLLSENRTVQMNRALRFSATIDTDGDGIPNGSDNNPLDPDALSLQLARGSLPVIEGRAGKPVAFTFVAAPGRTYRIEYTTDLGKGDWQLLKLYSNSSSGFQSALVQEAPNPSSPQRFFRVRAER